MRVFSIFLIGILFSSSAFARDTIADYSIKEALGLEKAKSELGGEVKFYFGDKFHGKILKRYGEFRSNRKTNAFGKSDKAACQWAFISAMMSLRDRALREGGNAVINIKSNYRNNLTSSDTTFQCGAGAFIAGAALVGDVVKIKE